MYDDCLIDLACAVIDLAREDYLTPLPNAVGCSSRKYRYDVNRYLERRKSARRFFHSEWFSILSLNQLSAEEVLIKLDEKAVKQNVNDCRISK